MEKKQQLQPLPYKITPEGSLGVLALGDVGVSEWRKVKLKYEGKPKG